jgi:hypothetical protein
VKGERFTYLGGWFVCDQVESYLKKGQEKNPKERVVSSLFCFKRFNIWSQNDKIIFRIGGEKGENDPNRALESYRVSQT